METNIVQRSIDGVSESSIYLESSRAVKQSSIETKQKVSEAPLPEVDLSEVAEAVAENMNKIANVFNASLNFSVDQSTGTRVITVVDNETAELIRQIPTKEALALIHRMRDMMGMLLDAEL